MNWSEYFSAYNVYLLFDRGLRKQTVDIYLGLLDRYHHFMFQVYQVDNPTELTTSQLRFYLEHLLEDNFIKSRTYIQNLSVIKDFHEFLVLEGFTTHDPARDIEFPNNRPLTLPKMLSQEEMRELLESFPEKRVRDRAILELMYSSGLRASEVVDLKTRDIDWEGEWVRIMGKGGKQRIVPVLEVAIVFMRTYFLDVHGDSESEFFFLSQRGGKLSRSWIFKMVKKAGEDAGLTHQISPHKIRHSFASHMIMGGADLRVVQEILGHVSITTTEIYLKATAKHLRETINKYHPRGHQ